MRISSAGSKRWAAVDDCGDAGALGLRGLCWPLASDYAPKAAGQGGQAAPAHRCRRRSVGAAGTDQRGTGDSAGDQFVQRPGARRAGCARIWPAADAELAGAERVKI